MQKQENRFSKQWRSPTAYLTAGICLTFVISLREIWHTAHGWKRAGPMRDRVAICIAGNARTFRFPFVHQGLLDRVITPLRRDYQTDVFLILRGDDRGARNPSLMSPTDETATLQAVRKLHPTKFSWITGGEFNASRFLRRTAAEYEAVRQPPGCGNTRVATVRMPHALYRAKQCLLQMEAHEQQMGALYDWVYRLRPDLLLFDRVLMPADLRPDTLYSNQGRTSMTDAMAAWWMRAHGGRAGYGSVADQMSISSRAVAEVALRAFDAVDDCELYDAAGQNIPEGIYRFWLLKQKVRYRAVPFDWVTVREHIGPECYRLYFQVGTLTNWTRSMERCYRLAQEVQRFFPKMSDVSVLLRELASISRPESDVKAL